MDPSGLEGVPTEMKMTSDSRIALPSSVVASNRFSSRALLRCFSSIGS
jgi:hypothetical protein